MPDQDYLVTVLQEVSEEEEEQEEKAPSLCDLPLTAAGAVVDESNDYRLSLSEPAEFFEFLKPNPNCSSSTFSWNDIVWPSLSSTADEDLFSSEKLRSLTSSTPQPPPPFSLLPSPSVSRSIKTRRSESFNESSIANRSSLVKSPCIRPSRSRCNCRIGFPSDRAINSYSGAQRRSPPWCWPVLGPLRHPPAAENEPRSGVKNRQPRSPATLFPAVEKASCDRRTWRLISLLSCKSHGSVAITTPFQPYCST